MRYGGSGVIFGGLGAGAPKGAAKAAPAQDLEEKPEGCAKMIL